MEQATRQILELLKKIKLQDSNYKKKTNYIVYFI